MRKNKNPRETLKCLRAGFYFILFFFKKKNLEGVGLNLGILFLGKWSSMGF